MDASETDQVVHRMLAELESEDPQFLAQGTLFERITTAYSRSAQKGWILGKSNLRPNAKVKK